MGKKSKQIGNENKKDLLVEKMKKMDPEQKEELKRVLEQMSDEQLEKMFQSGKISQSDYTSIMNFRKLKKKKSQNFEESIKVTQEFLMQEQIKSREEARAQRQERIRDQKEEMLRGSSANKKLDERLR